MAEINAMQQKPNSLGSLHDSLSRHMSQWKANVETVSYPSPSGEVNKSRANAPMNPWNQGGGQGALPHVALSQLSPTMRI